MVMKTRNFAHETLSNEMLASTQAKADALRRASSQFCDEALRRTEEIGRASCRERV